MLTFKQKMLVFVESCVWIENELFENWNKKWNDKYSQYTLSQRFMIDNFRQLTSIWKSRERVIAKSNYNVIFVRSQVILIICIKGPGSGERSSRRSPNENHEEWRYMSCEVYCQKRKRLMYTLYTGWANKANFKLPSFQPKVIGLKFYFPVTPGRTPSQKTKG